MCAILMATSFARSIGLARADSLRPSQLFIERMSLSYAIGMHDRKCAKWYLTIRNALG